MTSSIPSKQFKIETVENPTEEAAKHLNDIFSRYAGKPILFLVAGGSSLKVLDFITPSYLSPDMTVTVTDERLYEDVESNNFAILQASSFYNELIQSDTYCINTQLNPDELPEEHRARFERNIRDWKAEYPDGVIVALYGMGKDGHTGGMIPGALSEAEFEAEYNDPKKLVGFMDAKDKNPYRLRVSTTLPFMRDWVDHAVYYITGEEKKETLQKAAADPVSEKPNYFELPAQVMRHMKDVVVFTDIKL